MIDEVGYGEPQQNASTLNVRRNVVVTAAIALVICTNGPSAYLRLHVFNRGGGGNAWIDLYSFTAVGVVGVVALARQIRSTPFRRMPFVLFAVAAYVGWALASAVWSVSSGTTATNAMIGIGIAAFGCWFGWCLTFKEQIWSVMVACSAVVLASAAVILFLPQYGKMFPDTVPDRYWQGIFGNRNSLSPVCVLGLLALVGFVAIQPRARRVAVCAPLAAVHFVLLRGSGGATSLVALGAAVGVGILVGVVWLLKRAGAPGLAVAAVMSIGGAGTSIWILANMGRVASWMSRDATLTGRQPIWHDVRGFIRSEPIRGYGFWAFWDRADLTATSYTRLNSAYASAHNSLLEVMLGLGVIGAVFYLMVVLAAIVGLSSFVWLRPSIAAAWWSMVFAFLVVQNLMESFVLWHSYIWVLFIASAFVVFGNEAQRTVTTPQGATETNGDD